MIDQGHYKRFVVAAVPAELADTGEWQVAVKIFAHLPSETVVRPFSAGNSFKTREEAVEHCFEFARQIIDGQREGLSVDDIRP